MVFVYGLMIVDIFSFYNFDRSNFIFAFFLQICIFLANRFPHRMNKNDVGLMIDD